MTLRRRRCVLALALLGTIFVALQACELLVNPDKLRDADAGPAAGDTGPLGDGGPSGLDAQTACLGVQEGLCTCDGWCPANPAPTGARLRAVALSPGYVWVVGDSGTIMRGSRTGAVSWQVWHSATEEILKGVWAASDEAAWAVGDQGTVLAYADAKWSRIETGTTVGLTAVWGRGTEVFVCGEDGLAMRSSNGGTFVVLDSSGLGTCNAIHGAPASGPVWFVGDQASVFDGTRFTAATLGGATGPFGSVGVVAEDDVWLAGPGKVTRLSGGAVSNPCNLSDVVGIQVSPGDHVWMTSGGSVAHALGGACTVALEPFLGLATDLAADDLGIWVVGEGGFVESTRLTTDAGVPFINSEPDPAAGHMHFESVWGSSASAVWLAGYSQHSWNGKAFRSYDATGQLVWSVTGDGPDAVAVGQDTNDGTMGLFLRFPAGGSDPGKTVLDCGVFLAAAGRSGGGGWAVSQGECSGADAATGHSTLWSWATGAAPVPVASLPWKLDEGRLWTDGADAWVLNPYANPGETSVCRCTATGCPQDGCLVLESGQRATSIAGTSPSQVWVGTASGKVYRCDWSGASVACPDSSTLEYGIHVTGLWTRSATQAWATTGDGALFLWDGNAWTKQRSGVDTRLNSIFGVPRVDGPGVEIWAVGDYGVALKKSVP